jgi:hypothetical protein
MLSRRYLPPLLLFLLLFSSCRNTRAGFTATSSLPVVADSRAGYAPVPTLLTPLVANNHPSGSLALSPEAAGRNSCTQPAGHRLRQPHNRYNSHLRLHLLRTAPADTLPRQAAKTRHWGISEPRTGWKKTRHLLGRLLAWTVYLALLGLAGWLVFLTVEWTFALDILGIVFGGIPLIILAAGLFYFVMVFGFFTIVSEVPM